MADVVATKTLDVRGEICPYPDVNTMTTLKQMKKGEILEILLDYPLSVERIPRSAKKSGHKVLAVEQIDGPTHRILVEAFGLK
ncbi:MAG: sulfurtransferase-like selenium metabolism protein YedF [Anaerolineales bacterium]|nr:sulfurtransferase-like selenium metabolism protein YedF [Anaerolineales bacterium]